MKTPALVITAGVVLSFVALAAAAQTGPVQPRPGEGWTTEDSRKTEFLPRYGYIAATIVKLSVRDGGRFIVTLDNGTRWMQVETNADARVAVGDDIKLEKSSIGSYTLVTKDGISTRVQRRDTSARH